MNPIWHGLRYGSTMPARTWLTLSALFWGIAMLLQASTWDGTAGHYPHPSPIFDTLPRWVWGFVYLFDAALLFWRMVARKPRERLGLCILSWTSALWTVNVVDSIFGLGHFGPDHAAEAALMICAYWATLRTGITHEDKESA